MSDLDFTVLEGLRTLARQKELMRNGATRTMNSRHLTGHAVDLAPMLNGKVSWDWPLYHRLAKIVKAAAAAENVPLQWGGDWRTFKDGPHWELPWKHYPKGK
jgi:peptidoglycan L-alanyl-D-glutamate endopeptidase CwlK